MNNLNGGTDDSAVSKKQGQSVPAKRSTEPREVAELAHYPAFPVTDFATGATFALDGALQTNQRQGL